MVCCRIRGLRLVTPQTHRLVYTRHEDGGVSLCMPTTDILSWMSCGGYWNDKPRGFLQELVRRKTCPKLQKGHPTTEVAAWKLINALQWGGCTTQESWAAIAAHDCERFGHSIELQALCDVPTSRVYRDAWRRGHNSGQIYVDMGLARPIRMAVIERQVSRINEKVMRLQRGKLLKPRWQEIERNIARARDEEELSRVSAC